jgi:hypothetical protein
VRLLLHLQVGDADQRNALWLLMIQGEVNATDGSDKDMSCRVNAIDRCIEDQMLRDNLTVEDALRFLPEQQTLQHYKRVLLKHMEATSRKVCYLICSTTSVSFAASS